MRGKLYHSMRPIDMHGLNGMVWTCMQTAGSLKKNANTPRLHTWCCHVMGVTCAKFQGQSLTLAEWTPWLTAFMGSRSVNGVLQVLSG